MAKTLQFRRGTTSELSSVTGAVGELFVDTTKNTVVVMDGSTAGGFPLLPEGEGGGLAGASYVYVTGNGATATINGEELAAAYALAKTLTPYSAALSSTNRVQVVVAPGNYYVGDGTAFPNNRWDIDTEYVDIVSLSGERDVTIVGSFNITANDVLVRGLETVDSIWVATSLSNLKMENCKAVQFANTDADSNPISLAGTFTDCIATSSGFAGDVGSSADGTFIDCKVENSGVGFTYENETARGVFINCSAGEYSFGGYNGSAGGTFTNCTAGDNSFGYSSNSESNQGIADGTFTNCTAGYNSFGGGEGANALGTFTNCTANDGSFGGYQSQPGTFTGTIEGKLNYCRLIDGLFAPTSGNGKLHYCIDGNGNEVTSGGGLGGTSYVFVAGDKATAVLNGEELLAAYALAKTLTPFDNSLSFANKVQVVVAPGLYQIESNLVIDTDYVDVVSLTGNRDIRLSTSNGSTFSVTVSEVYIKGLDLITYNMTFGIADYVSPIVENCSGSDYSFGGDNSIVNATFRNCQASSYSFGGNFSNVSGTFTNCSGGNYSFGGDNGSADGTFTNCTAGDNSFGGNFSNVSGTFTNCSGGNYSFGGDNSVIQGRFENCQAVGNSFGGDYSDAYSNSQFINCKSDSNSFGGIGSQVAGTYTNCTALGLYCFGGSSDLVGSYFTNVSGTFTNCKAFSDSFGASDSIVTGVFTNCSSQFLNSFGGNGSTVSGTFDNCSGGASGNAFGGGTAGTFSGIARRCDAGITSFGQDGLTGTLYYCTTTGTFPTADYPGKTFYCVDSVGPNNQSPAEPV
jgi:hypothetical protein